MKHLSPVNGKARRLSRALAEATGKSEGDVVALCMQAPQQPAGPHIPTGCSTVFAPGWEVDRSGGTAGLCQPVERDLFDCHLGCFWPAQVPDQLNHAPDWTKKCAAAQKDWRKIDVIFP
ncbi:MAG TPA: quinohemoprotein amine dehydrogenase subunit gamma [Vicinamibacterales bacterium]|nr:quinohemoprotein amine dehydrogenase subunit gamma [Vicinamibacterales bacterium]